ncbi:MULTISPECIES: antibiotic biosynthesis monooxygenase [Acinetobacter]|uniref:Antibiotic biosynthesis monooxygenase n=1 Tax=Acinetobacter thutiue TaxID=2998078 RepID=A0ABT7WQN3_9GAMM|nr:MULTISPECIES: antibiotic biosynthesis monooxygenase [Acinetobacter]MCY6412762.1 antibiotic biosynthesis monooxygenase [Acinetobacter thutiue]MDH0033021.1 antibiotic biosynthesis monooxygenase [Acinetobacter sp. GD04021]MDH0886640.1 antibiotic biosynthesis monooxygenase [Acinetobacter sp. GD03873]MDH1083227.1 antibiotic biosynthesis monooxygenase [Acinetobacter sp. GD03983]MDH2189260.1 antibiotic biosynthesis monooxygenase [Acinetobacter sp. GD03645]
MYIVIFKATVKELDSTYSEMAQKLRNKALSQYHCIKFEACNENGFEIALSYWNSLEDIKRWQQDVEHLVAQHLGKEKWYQDFSVEICKVERAYSSQNGL